MMHYIDIKRCPFCGNPTKQEMKAITLNSVIDDDNYEFSISCLGCGISKRRNLKTINTLTFDQVIDAMNATIVDWNKRVNE